MLSNTCRAHGAGWRNSLLLVFSLLSFAFAAVAQAQSSATGSISGSVSNGGTRQFLNQAEVRIEGTDRVVLTDVEGNYTFTSLPAGSYTLVAGYTGLDAARKDVVVDGGKAGRVDFELTTDTYRMAEYVVAGETEGEASAVNRRKKAEHLVEAVSSEVFGSVTEGNLGEFLKNLSGIQIEYNAADARTIRVRGQEDFLTNVTVDGVQYASASSSNSTRAFEVDQININNIETIEVFKAPPPSVSPSIGGTVNMVTKNAFQ